MADKKTSTAEPVAVSDKGNFLKGVQREMKKVQWPTQHELITHTGVVAVAVFIVCSLIWICDTFFARLFRLILT